MWSCHVGHDMDQPFLQLKRLSLCCTSSWNEGEVLEFYSHVVGTSLSFINWQMHDSTIDGDLKPNSSRNLSQPVAPSFGSSFVASKLFPVGMGSCGGSLRFHYDVKMKWGRELDWIRRHSFDKWGCCHFFLYSCLDLDGFLIVPPFLPVHFFSAVQASVGFRKMGHLHSSHLPLSSGLSFSPHWVNFVGGQVKASSIIAFKLHCCVVNTPLPHKLQPWQKLSILNATNHKSWLLATPFFHSES